MANTTAFPFDAVQTETGYDREFSSADFASFFRKIVSNGVYANIGNSLQVTPQGSGMFIWIREGAVSINGRVREWTSTQTLRVENSDATYNRIDRVVARLDLINRDITVEIIRGIPSASPVAPAITTSEDLYELCLANVSVKAGAQALFASDITDMRDSSLCGYVSSMVGEDVEQALGTFLYGTSEEEIESELDAILGV